MDNKVKRRLTTIMASDCVDYSKHMDENEEKTLFNLKACRSIIDPVILEYGGRIFHTAGDSVIAEFSSPVDSVLAAYEFQKLMSQRNEKLENDDVLQWRVGIHSDDCIIEGEDIYGNGVNIAARLESHCEPGGVLLSRAIAELVNKKIDFQIQASGTRDLKNISGEFEVYTVAQPENSMAPQEQRLMNTKNEKSASRKPKIALLPFSNLNNDEESGYLVDGIVEDLTTEFSMIEEMEIISRQSSFDHRHSGEPLEKFVDRFSLDYLVAGSIRSSGKRIRISVELSDPETGNIVWSNKYDRVLEDIFDVQDEIVRKITIALIGEIEISSLNRAKRKPTENLTSYDCLLRGKDLHHQFTPEANAEAIRMLDKAIEADQKNGKAHAWRACVLGQALGRGYLETTDALMEDALNSINTAKELDEGDFECHRMLTEVYLSLHQFEEAEKHGQIAFDFNPNDPRVTSVFGEVCLRVGRIEEGISYLEKTYELDPVPTGQSNSDRRLGGLLTGYFISEDYEKCISIASDMNVLGLREWLLTSFAYIEQGLDVFEKAWFISGIKNFKDSDWALEVDRFHLNNEMLKMKLIEHADELTQSEKK